MFQEKMSTPPHLVEQRSVLRPLKKLILIPFVLGALLWLGPQTSTMAAPAALQPESIVTVQQRPGSMDLCLGIQGAPKTISTGGTLVMEPCVKGRNDQLWKAVKRDTSWTLRNYKFPGYCMVHTPGLPPRSNLKKCPTDTTAFFSAESVGGGYLLKKSRGCLNGIYRSNERNKRSLALEFMKTCNTVTKKDSVSTPFWYLIRHA